MNRPAPRSIDEYLRQLRAALAGEDAALIQDALYDAEEYLRAEIASQPGKSEADMLELIATTYGAPEEVATAYRDTEAKVKAALQPPRRAAPSQPPSAWRRFFGVYGDARAYSSLFFMLLALATGIIYFTFAVVGLSLSAGLAVLIIGVPFFLTFIGMARVISLGEGRLLEAITGERMPRRPVHPGPAKSFWQRLGDMLRDARTWSTIAYFILMLPLGIAYFTIAVSGLAIGAAFVLAPLMALGAALGFTTLAGHVDWEGMQLTFDGRSDVNPEWLATPFGLALLFVLGVVIVTALMHLARGIGRTHARVAKVMLVEG